MSRPKKLYRFDGINEIETYEEIIFSQIGGVKT